MTHSDSHPDENHDVQSSPYAALSLTLLLDDTTVVLRLLEVAERLHKIAITEDSSENEILIGNRAVDQSADIDLNTENPVNSPDLVGGDLGTVSLFTKPVASCNPMVFGIGQKHPRLG